MIVNAKQARLPIQAKTDPAEVFRKLYYHLYSNSNASRAERLLENLSLLLLCKLSWDINGKDADVLRFRDGKQGASESLLPSLRAAFPGLVNEQDRFSLDDDAIRRAIDDLDCLNLTQDPAHVLGDAFQSLIGPRLRGDKGQFFTPRSLVRAMIEVIAPQPHETILDPACGTAGFLVEAHSYRSRQFGDAVQNGQLIGIDKDQDLARLSTALIRIVAGERGRIENTNSLDPESWFRLEASGVPSLVDVILTNPPFGSKIGITDQSLLSQYDFGRQWIHDRDADRWTQTQATLASQDPQILFIELCVKRLRPGGRLGIVLPEGLFGNRQQGYVWEWLRSRGRIIGLLDCPRTTFQPGTDIKTNVLFFEKSGKTNVSFTDDSVRIAVALTCGHDRRGRSMAGDGRPYPDDFLRLGASFHADDQSSTSDWRRVTIARRDYLVPRYYAESVDLTPYEREITKGATTSTLKELLDNSILSIRKGHEVGSDTYGTGEVPFVRTSDISNFEISTDPTKSVSEDTYLKYAPQQRLKSGDILMVVDGRYRIGATALLNDTNQRCIVQSHIKILSILDLTELNPYSLLFALTLPSVQWKIRNLVFIQSTLGTLGGRISELRIPILTGDGPWAEHIEAFKLILEERARLLSDIQALSTYSLEL